MTHLTRRTLLRSTTALAATHFTVATPLLRALQPPSTPFTTLNYSQIQLLPSPLLTQFNQNHALFLALDNDRLLKPFRQLTGQPAPGEDMGGWYSPSPDFDPPKNMTGYIPGHSFGQYLSGLARPYAATGDKATQQKIHTLVGGYAATISPKFYERYDLPCYTFDKTVCGLIDAHQFAQDPIALDVLNHATDAVLPFLPDTALTRTEMRTRLRTRPGYNEAFNWDESYTLPENFYLAYTRGAGPRFHSLAQRFLQNKNYFTPLSLDQNVLPGEHAYSHVNALNSAIQAFLVDGSTMHLAAARNGFRFVQQQSYATGGWGPGETFRKPNTDELADSLTHQHNSFETPCGAYGHFKIARSLLTVTGDPAYGDSMETVLYNTILGARPIQPSGVSFYYADYNNDAHKSDYEQKWPCCSGTFPQLTADYGISTYLRSPRGLAVNLYHPSRVTWRQGTANVSLTQQTAYPLNGDIALHLKSDRAERFTLQLRIPAWATTPRLSINGRRANTPTLPGTWATLDRTWQSGDRIELSLDTPLRLIPLDEQHPNLVALAAGSAVLFALQPQSTNLSRQQLLAAERLSPNSPEWRISTGSEPIRLLPYPSITTERYRLYQQT
jgi:DUF1680 family protein